MTGCEYNQLLFDQKMLFMRTHHNKFHERVNESVRLNEIHDIANQIAGEFRVCCRIG